MPLFKKTFLLYLISCFFLPAICILLNTSCNSSSTADTPSLTDSLAFLQLPAPDSVSVTETQRINSACQLWFDTVLKSRGFSGGIIVAKSGKIIFEQYSGTGHIPGSDSITQNTALHIASISKTFTAMAVLKLWQDGKIKLDDELSTYFTSFNYPGVTIRSLLSHRSGLPNYNYFMKLHGWDESRYVSNQDVMDFLITHKAEMTDIVSPNTHFSYCNTNYALLALLIEKVSGLKYADYLSNHFFIPLQMKNSYVFTLADTAKAIPSFNWRGKPETFNFLDQVYGDKNIYTSARDLLTWDRALNTNLIFSDATLEQAYTPYSNEKPGIRNYGLGWRMNIFPDGNKIIYHNGWWHGSNATFIRLLKEKATIIVIGNKFTRAVYHAKILTSLFGNYYSPIDEGEIGSVKDSVLQIDSIGRDNFNPIQKTAIKKDSAAIINEVKKH